MTTPLRNALSHLVGWLADRRIPGPLREPVYHLYARLTGADLSDALPPLHAHASLGAFFVRRLRDGARPICADPALLPSPVDGTVQTLCRVQDGDALQAKGRAYPLRELLAGVLKCVDVIVEAGAHFSRADAFVEPPLPWAGDRTKMHLAPCTVQ